VEAPTDDSPVSASGAPRSQGDAAAAAGEERQQRRCWRAILWARAQLEALGAAYTLQGEAAAFVQVRKARGWGGPGHWALAHTH
jgi:hypothetical protein